MREDLLFITAFVVVLLRGTLGLPTDIAANSVKLDPVILIADKSETDTTRKQRSSQFGLFGNHGDYSDYDDNSYHSYLGHKRKFHKLNHKPLGLGGYGCRGYNCGGGWHGPDYEHYNGHHAGQGGSFAAASAGSIGGGGGLYGGHREANAQSASFSFGPYSATFSVAQAASGRKRF